MQVQIELSISERALTEEEKKYTETLEINLPMFSLDTSTELTLFRCDEEERSAR